MLAMAVIKEYKVRGCDGVDVLRVELNTDGDG